MSDLSANLYDLQVEILFGGSADAMRRRILAPLKAAIAQTLRTTSLHPRQVRVLDVACGTGRTMRFIIGNFTLNNGSSKKLSYVTKHKNLDFFVVVLER